MEAERQLTHAERVGPVAIVNGRSQFEIETPKGAFGLSAQYQDTWLNSDLGMRLVAATITLEQNA
jgi:hypothetical protein